MKKILFIALIFLNINTAGAAIIHQTTFNCPGTITSSAMPSGADCSGWNNQNYGSGVCPQSQIIAAANNPLGGSNYGYRNYVANGTNGYGATPRGSCSGSDCYIRWYIRHQPGFWWKCSTPPCGDLGWDKLLYIGTVNVGFRGPDSLVLVNQSPRNDHIVNGAGWNTFNSTGAMQSNGIRLGDGNWHCLEVHMKYNGGGATGTGQLWVDGVMVLNDSNVDYGSMTTFGSFTLQDNQSEVAGASGCWYRDLDDVVVSTTYIGPIGGVTQYPPKAPTNLRITP